VVASLPHTRGPDGADDPRDALVEPSARPFPLPVAASLPRLGDYEIVEQLGTGGMAEVYLARHGNVRGLERPVVLKRVLPHLARDHRFLEMFLDEARIVSSLHHPNIVRTIEVGCDDEEYFIALELVQGESLDRLWSDLRKRQQRLPPPLAMFIVAQVAHGLHHAHTLCDDDGNPLNVVHRDVSPHNVLVSFEGDVKIIDFGVAKARNRISHTDVNCTAKGKAGYMAPEQVRGEAVDARTDVFSLGVTLWELLRGERLFARRDLIASSRAVCEDDPPALVSAVGVDPAVDAIVKRALGKRPDERFTSAGELARELEAELQVGGHAHEATTAALGRYLKATFPERAQHWRSRMGVKVRTQPSMSTVAVQPTGSASVVGVVTPPPPATVRPMPLRAIAFTASAVLTALTVAFVLTARRPVPVAPPPRVSAAGSLPTVVALPPPPGPPAPRPPDPPTTRPDDEPVRPARRATAPSRKRPRASRATPPAADALKPNPF
jgi:serine/threonine-protein kinase